MSVSLPLTADVPLGQVVVIGLLSAVLTAVVVVVVLRMMWNPGPAAAGGRQELLERWWAAVDERLAADEEVLAELAAHDAERDALCEAFFTETTGRPLQRMHLHVVDGG